MTRTARVWPPRLLVAAAAMLAPFVLCEPALADVFGPIALASADPHQQADYAADPAISEDGRYVAFDGSFAGRPGVFRRDLATGQVQLVAEGDAMLPSISEDGRYVSFTTTARLDERNDTNSAPDVYVRDMDKPSANPCPEDWEESEQTRAECSFTLASAADGSRTGLAYAYGSNPSFEQTHYGSVASGRSALSRDGRHVAFVTTALSNLANPGRPAPPRPLEAPETPALQVAVRDLATDSTELVSVLYEHGRVVESASGQTQPVPATVFEGHTYGAVYPGQGLVPLFPSPEEGASISADGSTVAWLGQQIERQAPTLPAEPSMNPSQAEPLWRRIADAPLAPTRRVTGGGDPASEACAAGGKLGPVEPPTLTDPCQGPFNTSPNRPEGSEGENRGMWTLGVGAADYLPRLSADGRTVAFVSNAPVVGSGEFGGTGEFTDDLFVVDMNEPERVTRVQAFRRLTEVAGGNSAEPERTARVVDLGVSPDGSEIAFSTQRTVFPLGSPTYVSETAPNAAAQELYDVDLANDTLTRVTAGYEGAPSAPRSALTSSPSFSGDGNTLAFASTADNLVYGDGNGASDAFVVARRLFGSESVQQYISEAPENPLIVPEWRLDVTASSRPDGSVRLEAQVPGAGSLHAAAQAAVRVRRCAARAHRSCRRARRAAVTRTVGVATVGPQTAELVPLTLKLASGYSTLAARNGGLSASVSLTFSAPGHVTLHDRIAVTFRRRTHRSRVHARGKRASSTAGRSQR